MIIRGPASNVRSITAYHEAGHAVVAYCVGWYVSDKGIWIGGEIGNCRSLKRSWDKQEDAGLTVKLAGWLAERLFTGNPLDRMSHYAHDLADCLADARSRKSSSSDATHSLAILIQARPGISDDEAITVFQYYEEIATALINVPIVWDAIGRVARALLKSDKLTGPEIEAILAVPGRRQLLSAWCGLFTEEE